MGNSIIKDAGFHHIALRVADIDRSIKFYSEILGMTKFAEWGEGENRIAMMDMGNGDIIELFNGAKGDIPEGKYFHLAIATSDPDAAYNAAIAGGAKEQTKPCDVDILARPRVLPVRIAFVQGPDGEVIEFFKEKY